MENTVRCSSLPAAFKCGQSLRGEMEVSPYSEAGDVGNATHAVLAAAVPGGATFVVQEDIQATARRFGGVDEAEVAMLVRNGLAMWQTVGRGATEVLAEMEFRQFAGIEAPPEFLLTGHIDIQFRLEGDSRSIARILDWKTGRVDRAHRDQMMGYAALVMMDDPDVEQVVATIAWLRDMEVEQHTFHRKDLLGYLADIGQALASEEYRPGAHCSHCPRNHDCPALRALARRDVALFGDEAESALLLQGLRDMAPTRVVELHRKAKAIRSFCESFDRQVRKLVEEGGPLDAGDGIELRLQDEQRRKVDPLLAWPILQAKLPDAEIADCVTVSLSKVESAIADKAPRGQKKAQIEAIGQQLEAAGAVSVETIRKLVERRK